ncbi:hypothetical protein ACWDTP_07325 [Mycobacterium sp. NPDC003449]
MASTRYVGYVGGVAVAVGVGAAVAAAGQGTAHADSTDSGSAGKESTSSSSPNTGPKKTGAQKPDRTKSERTKPLSKINDGIQKTTEKAVSHVSSQVNRTVGSVSKSISDSLNKAGAKPDKPTTRPAKPNGAAFESEQAERLRNLFAPKPAATPKPADESAEEPDAKPVGKIPTVRTAVESQVDTTADAPWSPNPLRPDAEEPEPTDIPEPIMQLRDSLINVTPQALDAFDPFIREATEQIYRGTQMVPWVNAVIPVAKILPNLAPAVGDDSAARDSRQIIINELIKTLPIGSAAYYGYDIAADLLNLETPGAELKQGAFTTVWDLLDPFELAHNTGTSGI